jgi:hypothetical protein
MLYQFIADGSDVVDVACQHGAPRSAIVVDWQTVAVGRAAPLAARVAPGAELPTDGRVEALRGDAG